MRHGRRSSIPFVAAVLAAGQLLTLCAEEVCPAFLGEARRVHGGLPDPAQAGSSEEERLQAFREVRDELRRRLAVVFAR